MSITTLTPSQLRTAADLQEQIAKLNTQLAAILSNEVKAPVQAPKPAKRKMSPAHIAKIRAAQKLRWAKFNAAKAKTAPKPAAKPVAKKKGEMSADGKARIVAAQKARWAKIKAAKTAAKPVLVAKVVVAPKPVVVKPAKKKFVMSAAAKAKISAAAKLRWAAKKAGEKK